MDDAQLTTIESPSEVVPAGRREEHKHKTKRALQQAALELFARDGFDATTTEEIAERAGVSPRTFFRYFPTKESVLFVGQYGWLQSLTRHFLAQPAPLGDLEALRQTLVSFAPRLAASRQSFILYEKATSSSPTLRGRVQDNIADEVVELGAAIATRRGLSKPDEHCALLAATVLVVYRRAISRWVDGPAKVQPGQVIDEEFDILLESVAGITRNGRTAEAG